MPARKRRSLSGSANAEKSGHVKKARQQKQASDTLASAAHQAPFLPSRHTRTGAHALTF